MEKSHKNPFSQQSYIFSWPILILNINLSTEQSVFSQIMCSVILDRTSASLLNSPALYQISRLPSEIQARKRILQFTIYHKIMSFQRGKRKTQPGFSIPEGTLRCPLRRAALALPTCHLHPSSKCQRSTGADTALDKEKKLEEPQGLLSPLSN